MIPGLRVLARIAERIAEPDLSAPGFAREQGLLADASSALQSIDLTAGPHAARYAGRAIADLERVAGESG